MLRRRTLVERAANVIRKQSEARAREGSLSESRPSGKGPIAAVGHVNIHT